MNLIQMKVKDLIPYRNNPRKNDKAVPAVMASIQEFGFKVPIVVDKDNVVVCGHTRLKAAKQLKIKEVPVVVADDLTDEQIKAFRLADNKVSEQAEWDLQLLDQEINDIFNIDLEPFGFKLELDKIEQKESVYGEERERTFDYYKLDAIDFKRLTPKWQMPIIKKCDHIPTDLMSFNYMLNILEEALSIMMLRLDRCLILKEYLIT